MRYSHAVEAFMEDHLIDICDLDGEYFVNVRASLDHAIDRFYTAARGRGAAWLS